MDTLDERSRASYYDSVAHRHIPKFPFSTKDHSPIPGFSPPHEQTELKHTWISPS